MAFVCERGGATFTDLFPELANPHVVIDPADKPLYHAICTMAGNFTTLLWLRAYEVFEGKLELPRSILFPVPRSDRRQPRADGRAADRAARPP